MDNTLFYGDNLDVLRQHIDSESVTAGFYESSSWGRKYPKIQLFTIAELLAGKQIDMPPIRQVGMTFKKAPKASTPKVENMKLEFPEDRK